MKIAILCLLLTSVCGSSFLPLWSPVDESIVEEKDRSQDEDAVSPKTLEQDILHVTRQMWTDDASNRMKNDTTDLKLNFGPGKFFQHVDEPKMMAIESYSKMKPLMSLYHRKTGLAEVTSHQKELTFLHAVNSTGIMDSLHDFLDRHSLTRQNRNGFMQELKYWWFTKYNRKLGGTVKDTSGFEHVFVGEYNDYNATTLGMTGLHNWVQLYWEEKNLDIKSMTYKREEPDIGYNVEIDWNGRIKETSFFLGSSPEYQMAVFTLCFRAKPNGSCTIGIDTNTLTIKSNTKKPTKNARPVVATAYPVI